MPQNPILCRYRYDPLDRLATHTPLAQAAVRMFYQADKPITETQGIDQRSFLRYDHQLLACRATEGHSSSVSLTASDHQQSIMSVVAPRQIEAIAYTPYGHSNPLAHLPGFNGQPCDPITGHYLLGNGYRAFNPVLMRFNSPDSLSPFGRGGLNVYAYCAGDPVNGSDPSGHIRVVSSLMKLWRRVTRKTPEVPGLKSSVELLSLPRFPSSTPRKGMTDLPLEVFAAMQHNLDAADVMSLRQVSRRVNELSDAASEVNFNKYVNSTVGVDRFSVSTWKGGTVVASELDKVSFAHYGRAPGVSYLETRRFISLDAITELYRQNEKYKMADRRLRYSQGLLDYSPRSSVSSSGSQDVWLSRYSLDLGNAHRIRN
ncbi:RHS repeat-associated core domain-containing protein [Pseudomonas alliivorans]|nr:RHS repeat-associated core domain-containing protein [Pseudomonas alliivorans]MEE4814099.1 RHS repeat-associated core domain-containing protein [Pseudomonas alliivorans]MEE4874182.1 RHS repeat-associated core domain-containing protein [Pseudomonas alliivorans]